MLKMSSLWWLLMSVSLVSCGRVLVWQDVGSQSHFIGIKPLVEELSTRGQEVVFVSAYTDNHLASVVDLVHVGHQEDTVDSKALFSGTKHFDLMQYRDYVLQGQRASLRNERVRALLSDESEKFDVVIVSFMSMNVGLYAAKHIFKAPTIVFCANRYQIHLELAMGNPVNPSYNPMNLLNLRSHMSFLERLQNTLVSVALVSLLRFVLMPPVNDELERELQLSSKPDLFSDILNVDMVFYNTNPILDSVKPVNPNTVLIGGIHVRPANLSRIPQDVSKWIDGAEHGVILVSFGSILSSHELPSDKLQAMLAVFGELKESVLWKWEIDHMDGQPDNVLTRKWLPQSDILGHPKTKLFVTHGGMLGTQEALHHGVPMVAMPAFADQFGNAALITRLGLGTHLTWPEFNEKSFRSAMHSILDDPVVTERTREYGCSLRDELNTPLERAVWNVEHVIRHGHVDHLRPASKDLYWFQYFLMDVIAMILVMLAIALCTLRACCRCLCRRRHRRAEGKSKVQ